MRGVWVAQWEREGERRNYVIFNWIRNVIYKIALCSAWHKNWDRNLSLLCCFFSFEWYYISFLCVCCCCCLVLFFLWILYIQKTTAHNHNTTYRFRMWVHRILLSLYSLSHVCLCIFLTNSFSISSILVYCSCMHYLCRPTLPPPSLSISSSFSQSSSSLLFSSIIHLYLMRTHCNSVK